MRVLLDTHTFLWFIGGDGALSPYARQLIEDPTNEGLLSIASLWEIAIKVGLGRLTVPLPFTTLVAEHVYGNAIALFEVLPLHLDALTTLPFYHKDPFDRLIIAQGQAEDIPILSRDTDFDDYTIQRLWTGQLTFLGSAGLAEQNEAPHGNVGGPAAQPGRYVAGWSQSCGLKLGLGFLKNPHRRFVRI